MPLNIKNEEATRVIRELAAATGESLTTAITLAARERLARVRRYEERVLRRARLDETLAELRELLGDRDIPDHGEYLYDATTGLPK